MIEQYQYDIISQELSLIKNYLFIFIFFANNVDIINHPLDNDKLIMINKLFMIN